MTFPETREIFKVQLVSLTSFQLASDAVKLIWQRQILKGDEIRAISNSVCTPLRPAMAKDGAVKANKGSIERRALRHEARRYYSSASGNAWKVVDLHPATCLYSDGPMRFEIRREETNLVVDRGESSDEASARAKATELFKWNLQKRASCFELDQNWGSGSYERHFFMSRMRPLPPSSRSSRSQFLLPRSITQRWILFADAIFHAKSHTGVEVNN